MTQCPICNSLSHRVFQKYTYWILECNQCKHRFCEFQPSEEHPKNVYNNQYFTGGEAGYSDYLAENNLLIAHGEHYGALMNKYTSPGKMLDIGSAAGFILKGFENKGWSGYGIEPNATMAEYGNNELGQHIEVGTLESFQIKEQFKLVSMVQVIAHFYDIRKALQIAAELTEPGGYWLIESWNKDSWMARLLGENWHEYSPPSVLHWFSPDTLKLLTAQYGFAEVVSYRPPKWINSEHAKTLLQYKLQDSRLGKFASGLVNIIPNKMAIPYPNYDLFVTLFRKS